MAEEDLTVRLRTAGARRATRDVDATGKSISRLAKSSEHAHKQTGLLSRTSHGLLAPFHHLRGEVTGLAKSVVGMGLAFGSVEGIHRSIETTDELVKTTIQLKNQFGLTTESASGLAGVMSARNLAPQGLRMGLITLSKQMKAMAGGNDTAAEAFAALGITADDVRAGLAQPDGLEHIFERVTSGLTEMKGGADKAAYGQTLLGRATKSLAPLLQEGALGLEQQLKWAKEFGVTLDGKTIGSVEEMAAAQTKAQYAALGLQIQLGQALAPALTEVNTVFADVVSSFRDGKPEGDKYAQTIYEVGRDLKPVAKGLGEVGGYLKDHPKLLRAAAVGFIAYKTKLLSLLLMAPKAYAQGYLSGRAFSRGVASGMTEGEAAAAAGRGWFSTFKTTAAASLGTWIPPVVGVTVTVAFVYEIDKALAKLLGIPARGTALGNALDPSGGTFENLIHGRNLLSPAGPTGGGLPDSTYSDPRAYANRPRINPKFIQPDPTGGGIGGLAGPLVIELHHTTNLDGKTVAKDVHRKAIKAKSVR